MTIGNIKKKRTSKEQDPSQKSAISERRNTIPLNKYRSHIYRTSTRCHNINKTGMIYFQILIKKPCLHEFEIHTLSFRGTSFLTHRRHKEYREDGSDSDNNLICRYQGVTVRDIQTTCRTLEPFS